MRTGEVFLVELGKGGHYCSWFNDKNTERRAALRQVIAHGNILPLEDAHGNLALPEPLHHITALAHPVTHVVDVEKTEKAAAATFADLLEA